MENYLGTAGLDAQEDTEKLSEPTRLFKEAPTRTDTIGKRFVELYPLEPPNADSSQFTFVNQASELPEYTDLSELYCMVQGSVYKIKNGTKTAVTTSDNVCPSSYSPDSLFQKVDVFLNDNPVSNPLQYRNVYVQLLKSLSFGEAASKSFLSTEYGNATDCDDSATDEHITRSTQYSAVSSSGVGINRCANIIFLFYAVPLQEAPTVTCVSLLTHQLSGLNTYFLPKMSFKFVLKKAPDESILLTGPDKSKKAAITAAQIALDTTDETNATAVATAKAALEDAKFKVPSGTTYKFEIKKITLLLAKVTLKTSLVDHHKRLLDRGRRANYYFYR